ncbi:MAG: hypothetical protein JXR91_13820 [Deltaproteobacteria bacterium]|nr:hypothetical protein [Deltaproteobacteria bacterium]
MIDKRAESDVQVDLAPGELIAIQTYSLLKTLSVEPLDVSDCDLSNNNLSILMMIAICSQ